jgi:hypothetical protein
MSDIVERLRICAKFDPDQAEAADEIEKLRAALEEVRPLVLGANQSKDRYPKARAALGEKE